MVSAAASAHRGRPFRRIAGRPRRQRSAVSPHRGRHPS